MAQTFETPVSGTTTFGQLYAKIINLVEALRSTFSGTAFPASPAPVEGQLCYRTDEDKLYIYRNTAWEEVPLAGTLWQEIINARGTKPSIDQRLDVAMNEDGTLKAATSLNPSQWYKPSLTFTYISATSFKVNGDQRDIYKPTRRLKINITGSTVYSEVVAASYAASETTITIYDSVLTSALIDVEHSLFLPTKDNGALSAEMFNEKVVSKTTTYTTTLNDRVIKCDASGSAFTVTALAAATAGSGRRQAFKKTDTSANAVTINCGFNIVLTKYGETVEIESDGTNWFKVADLDQYVFTPDVFSDFVVSGLLGSDPGASLTMVIPGGVCYVIGKRVAKSSADADMTKLYTASKDTYVDINNAGAITYSEVANGAGAPAVATNSIRLQKVVTNGTEITSVVDLRTLVPQIGPVKPAFSVHKNGVAQNDVISGQLTPVTWPSEAFDTNSNFANNKFTPIYPTTKRYTLITSIKMQSYLDQYPLTLAIYKNGASVKKILHDMASGATQAGPQLVCVAEANGSTDYFEVKILQGTGTNRNIDGAVDETFFEGFMAD